MKPLKPFILLLASLLLFVSSATADHLPLSKQARGLPEHVLAGVNVYDDKMPAVIERLGKPDKFEESTSADYPKGSGERAYIWTRNGVKLRVATEFYTESDSRKVIESGPMIIDVWGRMKAGKLGHTGQSLSLGEPASRVRAIYGSHFQSDPRGMTIQWKEETTLVIELGRKGDIMHMQLLAAIE